MSRDEMNEFDWQQSVKTLPLHIQPYKDLWPGIESRLEPREGMTGVGSARSYWRLPAIAAAILIALTTGIFIGGGLDVPSAEPFAEQTTTRDYVVARTTQNAELEFQAAFKEVLTLDYSGMQPAGSNPDALRSSWEDMQKAEASLLAALNQYPNNHFLNTKLVELRSNQLRFMKQMVFLEQNNWRRT